MKGRKVNNERKLHREIKCGESRSKILNHHQSHQRKITEQKENVRKNAERQTTHLCPEGYM